MADPLDLLERDDKHYLGAGAGVIFAPRFPRWLHLPGFWDELDVFSYTLANLFTVTFLTVDGDVPGTTLSMRQLRRRWSPAQLVARYALAEGLEAREHRSVLPGGWLLSEWALTHCRDEPWTLMAVAWTAQDTSTLALSTARASLGSLSFARFLQDRQGRRMDVDVLMDTTRDAIGSSLYLSEGSVLDPIWESTPFLKNWRDGVSTQERPVSAGRGILHGAVVSRLTVPPGQEVTVAFRARVRPKDSGLRQLTGPFSDSLQEHCPAAEPAQPKEPGGGGAPGLPSRSEWAAFFDGLPELACSDPYIERYWYYRWYGLRLCSLEGGVGNYPYPGCCEGTGYFHLPIAYSAQCHARELRWLSDPARARGVLLNFLAQQKPSGQLHGRLYVNHLEGTDFYFADWGDAVLCVDAVHPDLAFLRAVYGPLSLYAGWLDRARDADESGLTDVVDHFETGQEYMSRYMAVSREADSEAWGQRIRLKGVDATVYTYRLQRALAVIAGRLHEFGEAGRWIAAADRTGEALLGSMWDSELGMFSDIDPQSMRRTGVKAAVCFYPYFTDLVGPEHVSGLRRHLFNPEEFWTEFPVPSTSADDPTYSPDGEWKGERLNCAWNGRVWPMANSHVAEALAGTAIELDDSLRPAAAEFIRKFIRMMFHDGDVGRPNCYEHYNPETGQPSLYRGFDDYQHSWVNDLIVKYVAGFRPAGRSFVVDPLPFGLRSLRLASLPFQNHRVDIEIDAGAFKVSVNGERAGESRIGEAIEVAS
jgi:hypothetical protein